MVEFSRYILHITLFILLPAHCRLFNKTIKDIFRYGNSTFFLKNSVLQVFFALSAILELGPDLPNRFGRI